MKGSSNSAGNPVSYLPTRDAIAAPAAFIPTNRGTGPSLDTPELISLYWGDFAQAEIDGMQTYLNNFAGYLSGQGAPAGQEPDVRQYGVTGATIGVHHLQSTKPAAEVSDADLKNQIVSLQNTGLLPAFSDTRLFLIFTKGINFSIILDGGSYGQTWCGYHQQWSDGQYYALCPFPSTGGCISTDPIQSWQSITSHEILEAATDPKPFTGWTPEIGDQCAWQEVALPFGTVQKVADKLQQTCSVWTPIRMTDTALAVVGAGNNVEFFAKNPDGRIFYNYAQLGQGGQGWNEVPGDFRTDAAPAAGAIGTYVYVAIKAPDGNLWLNQGELGHGFVGWQSMT